MTGANFPEWLVEQRGRRHRDGNDLGYLNRNKLIRRYARYLLAQGKQPTFADIRSMLAFVDRGYSMKADQISRALGALYRSSENPVAKAQNGWPVIVEGREYQSARAAAGSLAVSVQTVLRRIASAAPEWSAWRRSER